MSINSRQECTQFTIGALLGTLHLFEEKKVPKGKSVWTLLQGK